MNSVQNLLAHGPSFLNASRGQPPSSKRMKQGESERRSSLKCDACRKRKVKCLPPQRDWEKGERCEKCVAKGDPCGPHRQHNDPAEGSLLQPGEPPPPQPWGAPQAPPPTPPPPLAPGRARPLSSGIAVQPNFPSQAAPFSLPPRQSGPSHDNSSSAGYRRRLSQKALSPTTRPSFDHHSQPAHLTTSIEVRLKQGSVSLRHARALYLSLLSRRQQVAQASPFQPDRHFDQVDSAVEHQLGLAYNDFVGKLTSQLDNIKSCPGDKKEPLRMLLGIAKKFLDQPKPHDTSCEQHGKRVHQIYADVLLQLVCVCYGDGEQEEADEILLDLIALPGYRVPTQEILSWVSQALKRRSDAINEAFSQLEVLPKKKTVSNDSGNIFPVSNAAIEAGLDCDSLNRIASGSSRSHSSDIGICLHDTIQRGSLHIAVERRNLDQVRCLVNSQALESRDSLSMTPLLLASLAGHLGVFRLLSEAGANLDARDRYGRNAIIIACEKGNVEIARFLVDRIRYTLDKEYQIQECTLLYAAASQGYSSLVQLLLTAGADPRKRVQGKLPHEAAAERRHTEVVDLLQQAMNSPFSSSADDGRPDAQQHTQEPFQQDLPTLPGAEDEADFSMVMNDQSFDFGNSTEHSDYQVMPGQYDTG